MKLRFLFVVCGALFLGGLAAPARAGEPTDQVRSMTDRILAIAINPDLKDPSKADERLRQIREVTDQRFDWQELGRRAMGTFWRDRTDAEKAEFLGLFRQVLENTYLDQVLAYTGKQQVRYVAETVEGNLATVKVTVISTSGVETPLEYRLYKRQTPPPTASRPASQPAPAGPQWWTYDVSVEGVSLVNNYRSQIRDIMSNGKFTDLIKKLKDKLTEQKAAKEKS